MKQALCTGPGPPGPSRGRRSRPVPFDQQLLEAAPEECRRLIRWRPSSVGEREVEALAEQARAAVDANPAASLRIAGIACDLAEALGEPRARALAERGRAVALRSQARWEEALAAFEAGARLAEAAGDSLLAAQIPIAATHTLAQLGRHDEALRLAASLEARLRAMGAAEDAAKVVGNAGNIYFERDAYAEALACWQRALAYFQALGETIPVARLQVNVANVLTHLNRLPEALRIYREARAALDAAGQSLVVAGLDGNLGFLHALAGRYGEALRAFARARARFEALDLPMDVAKCDRETADIYLELNLIPEANEAYERARPVFLERQMAADAARCEIGLAAVLAASRREGEAFQALDRAEQAFRGEGNQVGAARVWLLRSEVQRLKARGSGPAEGPGPASGSPPLLTGPFRLPGAPPASLACPVRAALRAFRRHGVQTGAAQARLRLAELRVEAGGSPVRALRRLAREAEAGGGVSLLWRIELALARACKNAGNERAAAMHYRRAVEGVERVWLLLRGDDFRIAFLQDKMRLYEELLGLLLAGGQEAALLEGLLVTEQAKSRSLLELLSTPVRNQLAADPEQQLLLRRLDDLRAQLNWDLQRIEGASARPPRPDPELPARIRSLEAEYQRTRRQIQLGEATMLPAGESLAHSTPAAVRDLQATLRPGEQLLEFAAVGNQLVAFVLDREHFHVVENLACRVRVEEEVRGLQAQWTWSRARSCPGQAVDRPRAATRQALAELYELLLARLEPLLPGARVVVVPHGMLHGLPFHALLDGERYALDRWEFAYAPSAGVWRASRLRRAPEAAESLVFGAASPEIAHVRQEVAALRRILPDARIYEGEAASLAAVPTSGCFRYLHFATHAVFREDNPLFSGLQLADGWLVAADLYHRHLECRLATLSACRTGTGRVAPGDELLGLARGFLHAGAQAVMASLWTADDAATAMLMQECYARLAAGMGRAAALRAAQQAVRQRYPHPYYWAAFSLIGSH